MTSGEKATLVIAVIGILITLVGVMLMFFTLTNMAWVKNLRTTSRIKHGILSAFILIVGILFIYFNFLGE